jgi:ligand-binding sensor domain-containing protein/signal transduction histidine kinase
VGSIIEDKMQKVIFILIAVLITACNSTVSTTNFRGETKINPKVISVNWDSINIVPANGYIIDTDTVKNPVVLKAGIPETHTVYSNVHIAGIPIVDAIPEKLTKIIPGKDSEILIKTNPAKGKRVNFNYPAPVLATPARFMDDANYNIRNINLEQGISSSFVRAILEDSRGNFWIGTYDKGVSMYNGEHFTHFTVKDGLSSNTINTIFEDSKGNIWFGTWGGGACMYNGVYFTHFTEEEGLAENHVYAIFEDRQGNIWFGTEGRGVCVYNGKTIRQFTEKNSSDNDIIRAITQDIDGNIWIGTYDGGLLKYSVSSSGKESFVRYTEKDSLCNDYVRTLYADKKGRLWIGTNKGLDVLYKNKFTHYTTDEGLNNNIITKIIKSRNGNMIICTRGMGASIFNGKTFTYITKKEGLNDNIITSVIEDEHGVIWFGTRNGGLNLYNPNSFKHLTEKTGMNGYPITSVLTDREKNIWFGTSGGGLGKYGKKVVSTYTTKEGLSHDYIYSLLEDKNGNIWAGTSGGGVNKLTKNAGNLEFTHFGAEEGLSDHLILAILEDKKGNIWFSAKNAGVFCYDGINFTNYNKTNGLNNNTVFTMLEIQNGDIWFGTYGGGINIFDGENFKWFTKKEGLSDSSIFSLYEDAEKNIWIGTEKAGVLKFNGQNIIQFTETDGLNSNLVGAIIEDSLKRIWLGTNNGLNVIQTNSDSITSIYGFNEKDGLKNLDFSMPSLCMDKENRILWANGKDITIINSASFKLETAQPRVKITNIDINQEHIDYRQLSDTSYCKQFYFCNDLKNAFTEIDAFTNYPKQLELPYNINYLTFWFTTNNHLAPHKVKYSYFMQGLDNEWSIPSSENKAVYRNIPYGKYILKVRAIGETQKWGAVVEYPYIINRPWWITWWAYLLYFIALNIFIVLIVKLRTKQLEVHEKLLEKKVDERTKEVEQQKEHILTQNKELIKLDEFKQNMSSMIVHDLKTPLSNILSLTEAVEHGSRAPSINNAHLIKQMGKQMLNLTLNMLDVSKFEDAKIELKIKYLHLKTLVNDALSQIIFLAEQKNLQINNLVSTEYFIDGDKEIIERVFVNLLTNSIKYSPQNGKLIVNCIEAKDFKQLNELEKQDDKLVISIKDFGEGIAPENAEHVFEKFAQISEKKSGSIKSTGIGLTFCKLAVEAHGGKIGLNSKLGEGSCFWFILKKSEPDHLQKSEITLTKEIKQKTLKLSSKEVELLNPIFEKLQNIQFYEVTTIKKLLQEFDFSDNIVLQEWKNELENSVLTCNKQKYEAIISLAGRI